MHPLDAALLVGWVLVSVGVGVWFGRRASSTAEGFLVADRQLPWWVVGTSMVATTFAADTPLVVSGLVATAGVAGNWTWWWMGASGVLSVFFFARLWRRAGVLTDAELAELRYEGRGAVILRASQAVWFGVVMNVLVIAWVMAAMRKLLGVVLSLPDTWLGLPSDALVVAALFLLTVAYTSAAGLLGVVATDVMQFVLAICGAVLLAVLAWSAVGGIEGLGLAYAARGLDVGAMTRVVPTWGDGAPDGELAKFLVLALVLGWASKQVDGGGYLAQRLFSARDERHATWAALWFTVAHVCVRPWPWVLVGLAGLALLGPQDDPELIYPMMMTLLLPVGAFGLVVASFLAAFMSTVDTQLHWGASLVVQDLWRRFLRPEAAEAEVVRASRLAVVALAAAGAVAAMVLDSLVGAWELVFSISAGLGPVLIARWYWWRTTAWSEIAAMLWGGVATMGLMALHAAHPAAGGGAPWLAAVPHAWLAFPFNVLWIVGFGLPVWLLATAMTRPASSAHLLRFYARVRPGGPGWRALVGTDPRYLSDGPGWAAALGVLAALVGVYGTLLGTGWLLLGHPVAGGMLLAVAAAGALVAGAVVRLIPGVVPSSNGG